MANRNTSATARIAMIAFVCFLLQTTMPRHPSGEPQRRLNGAADRVIVCYKDAQIDLVQMFPLRTSSLCVQE